MALKPSKWSISSRKPVYNDIVLFTYNDSGDGKNEIDWKLGRVTKVFERKVEITFLGKVTRSGAIKMHTLERNPRDISILFSTEDFAVNTQDHYNDIIKGVK